MRIQSLLLLMSMFLWLVSKGEAAMVEYFSIIDDGDIKTIIQAPEDIEVGIVKEQIKGNVQRIEYKQKSYFMKDAKIHDDKKFLEFQDKISGLVASYILNELFRGEEQRYPLLRLVFDPESIIIEKVEPFYILSEELQDFKSIEAIANKNNDPYYKDKIKIEITDLENLYLSMYLVGGGDPHMRNIIYNSNNYHLGNVI